MKNDGKFKLGKETRKDAIIMSRAWDKGKNLSPNRNRTYMYSV